MDLTVVIPTYNRRALLADAVASLRRQTHPADRYELLIISDGSTDGSDDDYATPLTGPATRLVRQEKRGFGLSRARNLGTRLAAGRLVMFFDDDMVAEPGLVAAHVAAHARFNDPQVAVCGRVKLAPDLPQTPFCQIVLGDICRLFADDPDQARFLPCEMGLSWQTSYWRSELERLGGFDEEFRSYGWEDIEFSFRASQQGLRFYLEPAAVSLHRDQRYTLERHAERLRNSARMAPLLFERHPELRQRISMYADKGPVDWSRDRLALILKKASRRLLSTAAGMSLLRGLTPWVERATASPRILRRWYYAVLSNDIDAGYRQGLAEHAPAPATDAHSQPPGTASEPGAQPSLERRP